MPRACGLCNNHGFLVTSKQGENGEEARQRLNKDTLIDFSYALALPKRGKEAPQTHTRSGVGGTKEDGQTLMTFSVRSGEYALLIRYRCVGIGADLVQWTLLVTDEQERLRRHQAILSALRDTLISPDGALTATMLPHLTGLVGIIVVNCTVGRAPLYSLLQEDFRERLLGMQHESLQMSPFESVDAFYRRMNELIGHLRPARLPRWNALPPAGKEHQRMEGNK